MIICGTDEAGRGPIISVMVLCGVSIEETDLEKLKNLGVTDSKLLTPVKRTNLAKELPNIVNFSMKVVTPQEIDEAVNSEITNLNWLEADKTIEILEELKPDSAIIDCPSPNITAYENYIKNKLVTSIKIKAEHKADLNHLIVGAASILAKVKRDEEIEKLKEKLGIDIGSGYPSDPKTKIFLKNYWNVYPEIFRKSWAPYKKVASTKV